MRLIFIVFFFFSLVFLSGCKKCFHCENVCYKCTRTFYTDTTCTVPVDFESLEYFIQTRTNSGESCVLISANKTIDYCDKSKPLAAQLEADGYVCTTKK